MTRPIRLIPLAACLILLAAALAGCSTPAQPISHFGFVANGARPDVSLDVPFAAEARSTAVQYDAHNAKHPDFYSAFDQLDDAAKLGHFGYNASYDPDLGFFLKDIAGVHRTNAYWMLSVNGAEANHGMGDIRVFANSRITWTLTTFTPTPSQPATTTGTGGPAAGTSGAPSAGSKAPGQSVAPGTGPGGAPAIKLTIAAMAPSKEDIVTVHGTSDAPRVDLVATRGTLSVAAGQAKPDNGVWSTTLQLPRGTSNIEATTPGGETAHANATVLAKATFEVKYTADPRQPSTSDEVWFNLDNRSSAPAYKGKDVQHPDKYTVHDLMRTWEAQTKSTVTYEYDDGLGYAPIQFNGVGNPLGLGSTAPPYWCYKLNGASASLGISLQEIKPNDSVTWEYAGCV